MYNMQLGPGGTAPCNLLQHLEDDCQIQVVKKVSRFNPYDTI